MRHSNEGAARPKDKANSQYSPASLNTTTVQVCKVNLLVKKAFWFTRDPNRHSELL